VRTWPALAAAISRGCLALAGFTLQTAGVAAPTVAVGRAVGVGV
jgi:hypothetical protein